MPMSKSGRRSPHLNAFSSRPWLSLCEVWFKDTPIRPLFSPARLCLIVTKVRRQGGTVEHRENPGIDRRTFRMSEFCIQLVLYGPSSFYRTHPVSSCHVAEDRGELCLSRRPASGCGTEAHPASANCRTRMLGVSSTQVKFSLLKMNVVLLAHTAFRPRIMPADHRTVTQ